MNSNPGSSKDAPDFSALPRGLLGRKGMPVGRATRLPSIRGARDLTLGGPSKRVFKPNIPARRSQQDHEKNEKNDSRGREHRRGGSGRGRSSDRSRGRGRGRGREFIQLQGVFTEGPAERAARKRGTYASAEDESKQMQMPKFTPGQGYTKEMKQEDELRLKELLRDDFYDYGEEETDDAMLPIQLPLSSVKLKKEAKTESLDIKKEEPMDSDSIKIKEEPLDETEMFEDLRIPKVESKPDPMKPVIHDKERSLTQMFSGLNVTEGEMLFFQFPDIFPGVTSIKTEPIKTENQPPSQKGSKEQDSSSSNTSCSLSDFQEGWIGKLQLLRSGKARLVFGDICFSVELGGDSGLLQDVVSIETNAEQRTGDLHVLGHIHNKLICSPDIETLLKKCLT